MKQTLLGTALFLLASTTMASALTFNSAQFIGIDRNADNMISMEEAQGFRHRYFTTLDIDGNGEVSFAEYVEANKLKSVSSNPDAPVKMTDEFKEADANGDKTLTMAEFLAVGEAHFKLLDKDGDGFVSRDEFVAPGL
ncbi:EF-hand domain-containing protein [Sneathiella limimaris]|uniref:EF-hand domain-containing protein n=1 Tax=Sneathiella limimaris TaxID=1964213 RepID=UPI00146C092A|nr:EF-hand domain-containing protein [Sneathiella limimaris]